MAIISYLLDYLIKIFIGKVTDLTMKSYILKGNGIGLTL